MKQPLSPEIIPFKHKPRNTVIHLPLLHWLSLIGLRTLAFCINTYPVFPPRTSTTLLFPYDASTFKIVLWDRYWRLRIDFNRVTHPCLSYQYWPRRAKRDIVLRQKIWLYYNVILQTTLWENLKETNTVAQTAILLEWNQLALPK